MPLLQGKVIAITGASSGIGLATAKKCAEEGARLALCDINQSSLSKVVDDMKASGIDVIGTPVDVANAQSVNEWISKVMEHYGRIDGAANVAGVEGRPGDKVIANIVDIEDEAWDFILSVNLTGLFYCLRAQLRVMGQGGSILNVASMAGLMGRPGIGAYGASKHGVVGLTRTAAKEVGARGIRVNAVAPGPVKTRMLDRLLSDGGNEPRPVTETYKHLPLQRLGTPEDIANTICFALSDQSAFTTGAVFSVDGGVAC